MLRICTFFLFISINVQAAQQADVIYINATIYHHPAADSIAVNDGSILFIGNKNQADIYRHEKTKIVDLKQAFLMPGFIDNHNHVFEAASEVGGNCELNVNASLEEQIPYLKICKNESNNWIIGYGFSLDAIFNEHERFTPLQVLDSIFPKQPIVIMEQTSHAMWVNSVALKRAKINKNTQQPQGGKYLKDTETGELNGILLDNAGDLIMDVAWNNLPNQSQQSYQGLMNGLEEAAANGITTIGDGRLYWRRGWYEVWQQAERQEDLTARISLRPWIYPTQSMSSQIDFLKKIQSNDKSRLLLINQVKMYSDGIFINGTAKLLSPYLFTYLPEAPYGINYIPPKAMKAWLTTLDSIGYSAHIHAIGDGAVHESLNAIESVRKRGSQKPYTLTHVELINTRDIRRFKKLNVTADFQVGADHVVEQDHQWATEFIGQKRSQTLMNLGSIIKTNANVTLSSDWNVNDINPLVGISNSLQMSSRGFNNIDDAIAAYTINAAKSLGLSDITGSLSIGKSADFVILNQDISRLSKQAIADTKVLMTVLRGDIVYQAQ